MFRSFEIRGEQCFSESATIYASGSLEVFSFFRSNNNEVVEMDGCISLKKGIARNQLPRVVGARGRFFFSGHAVDELILILPPLTCKIIDKNTLVYVAPKSPPIIPAIFSDRSYSITITIFSS